MTKPPQSDQSKNDAPAPAEWVTFVGDPFHGQSTGTAPTEQELLADSNAQPDEPLSLDAAAQDYLPEETPTQDDLERLAQLSVAMAAQNAESLAQFATIAESHSETPTQSAALETEPETELELETTPPDTAQELPLDLPLDLIEAQSCIEALLFITDKPLTAEKLHAALGETTAFALVQEALTELVDRYAQPSHGFELVTVGGGYQFRTKPGRAHLAQRLAKVQTQKLSAGAMETLALVSYKQPVMKEEIDAIRGVDSSYFIRTLMDRKLIKITGRSDLPGRPMVYGTTQEFLELFGLKDLGALPSLRELEGMVPASSVGRGDEDPRVLQMRGLVSEMTHDLSVTLAYDPEEDDRFLSEIREKVKAIPTTTATLLAQDQAAKEQAAQEHVAPAPAPTL